MSNFYRRFIEPLSQPDRLSGPVVDSLSLSRTDSILVATRTAQAASSHQQHGPEACFVSLLEACFAIPQEHQK
jgi:hypothetical protein